MRLFILLFFICSNFYREALKAQIFDDFHDQNLFQGLIWGGDLNEVCTNQSRQLQLNADSSGSTQLYFNNSSYPSDWECQFWLRLNLSPSSLNFCRYYLSADQSDLLLANNALFIEFGEAGSQDAPKLYCRNNGSDSLLAQGPAGSIAAAFQLFFRFKVVNGAYSLEVKTSPAAASSLWLSGLLPWLPAGPYAGLAFIYSSSNKQNFYLDDLYFGPPLLQQEPLVLMTEIMADPEPTQGLPNTEYIELYNAGTQTEQLSGYKLYDENGFCTLPSFWLLPGAYATLVGSSQSAGSNPSKTIEVSAFPSLNNSGETLHLRNTLGNSSDFVPYELAWYQDSLKAQGGYSLERCALQDPCSAADNWRASNAILGGTPNQQNSVLVWQPDTLAALLLFAEVRDSNMLALGFSEPMDSISLAQCGIQFSTNLGTYNRSVLPYQQMQYGAQLLLFFIQNLPKSQKIDIDLQLVADCWGNQSNIQSSFVRYELPQPGDLLLNEILFDPPTFGADFIELYNTSHKYLQINACQISNGQQQYWIEKQFIEPKQFLALCPDTGFLNAYYPVNSSVNFAQQQLPYFYNDSGTFVLQADGILLDQFNYSASWHSPLLLDTEGISLERLSCSSPTQSEHNWFSAAKSTGGATPGLPNSQQISAIQLGSLTLSHPELSPDQDGYHDFLEIQYELPEPNMLVQASIYTLSGQIVKQLSSNELFATSGVLIWDGSTDFDTIAGPGIYILDFQAFSTDPSVFFNRKLSFARCIKH